jgi:polysaccharide biosynthesis/export protein
MRNTIIPKLAALMIAGASFCGGQTQAQSPAAPQRAAIAVSQPASPVVEKPFAEHNPRYELRANDILDLSFEFSPEFNQAVTVQPDGYVTLRSIGDVYVAGQSIPQVTVTIKAAYSKILNDPALAIVLKDFEKPYFIAAGKVAHPGKYELRGDTTLTEAVAIAGGFEDTAKHSHVVYYHRVSNDWMEGKVVDIKKMMASRDLSEDIHVRPGDMIFVPQNSFSKFQRFIPSPGLGMGMPIP